MPGRVVKHLAQALEDTGAAPSVRRRKRRGSARRARHQVGTTDLSRASPRPEARIIRALRAGGHTVGFIGDGINDAPALHAADIGLSVEGATGVARAAADMIMLEADLEVVVQTASRRAGGPMRTS